MLFQVQKSCCIQFYSSTAQQTFCFMQSVWLQHKCIILHLKIADYKRVQHTKIRLVNRKLRFWRTLSQLQQLIMNDVVCNGCTYRLACSISRRFHVIFAKLELEMHHDTTL
ncbi:hypothetical protein HPP92_014081 [Vanilla planifolia]|uniref:Uncharacterized protein n=1 Tax=Vanilla planifolia TaxID=51239 RepID=A0A835QLN1_VANPL|nr:hypothetical protein HPP92_014522 [Vanilla planifolia]KAG0474395.1 hypothetical protein HPP92_014081 [Vanilla planifolia]